MIGGVITVVSLLVTRMPDSLGVVPQLPPGILLPQGAKAQAVTLGQGWVGVVTQDNRFLIYSEDGALRQEMTIQTAP